MCIIFPLRLPVSSQRDYASRRRWKKRRSCVRGFTCIILGEKEVKLTMEVEWIADRAALRSLAKPHPEWTQRELADAVGRSLSWIKKWLKRLREAPPDDLHVLLSHSRAHH